MRSPAFRFSPPNTCVTCHAQSLLCTQTDAKLAAKASWRLYMAACCSSMQDLINMNHQRSMNIYLLFDNTNLFPQSLVRTTLSS